MMNLDFKFSVEDVLKQERTNRSLISEIQKWLLVQEKKFIPRDLPEALIILFLLCFDNDMEITKKAIISFYELRFDAPDIFDGRDMDKEDVVTALRTMTMVCIPTRTETNDSILLIKLNDSDYRHFHIVPEMKLCCMVMDLAYHGDPPNGLLLIVDMDLFGFRHLARLKMDAVKLFFTYLQDALPLKLTSFHFLNSNFVLRTVWSMVKVFIKDDVLAKFFLHEPDVTQEKLFNHIPRHCLPINYGGYLPDINALQALTVQQLRSNQEFWDREEAFRKQSIILDA